MLITIMVRLVMQVRPHHLSIDVRYQRNIVQLCTTRERIILFTFLPPHTRWTALTPSQRWPSSTCSSWSGPPGGFNFLSCKLQCWLPGPCSATSTEGSLCLNFLWFDIQQNVEQWNMATEPVNFWQELRQGWHFRQPSELVHLKMFLKWLKPFGGYTTKRRRDGKSEWVEALRRKMDKNDKTLWRKTPRLTFETDSRQLWFLKRFIYNCLQKIYESANISGRLICFAL